MTFFSVFRKSFVLVSIAGLAVMTGTLFLNGGVNSEPFRSIEYGIASVSPSGPAGGYIIPASCGSPHAGDQCTPPVVTASGNNGGTTIVAGSPAIIEWEAPAGVSSCYGINFATGGEPSGSVSVTPDDTTTYTVNCSNGGQNAVTVTVVVPVLSLEAEPPRIQSGNTTTLTWNTTGTLSCQLSGAGVSWSGVSGSALTPQISQPTIFTLTCQTAGGPVSTSLTVNLLPSFVDV